MRRISEPDMPSDIADTRRAACAALTVSIVPVADPGSNMAQPRCGWATASALVAGVAEGRYRKLTKLTARGERRAIRTSHVADACCHARSFVRWTRRSDGGRCVGREGRARPGAAVGRLWRGRESRVACLQP